MIITQLTDLSFQITNLYNNDNEAIRIQDCDSFVAKFYTTDLDNSAVCLKLNDELTNIKIEENADYCLINSTDLSKMKDGVLFFQISYSVADNSYSDGLFNNTIAGNTNYYINLNNSGENDYYTKEEIDEKLDEIVAGGEIDLSNYYKKSEVDNLLLAKADKSELSTKQDTLISGENIKTINGNSLLGSGDITITGSGDVDLSNYYNKVEVDGKLDTKLDTSTYNSDKSTFALKTELSNYLTTSNAAETYQPIGDYLTEIPSEYVTDTELSESLNNKVDVTAYTADKSTFALKSEIPTDYVSDSDLANYALKSEIPDTSNFATTETVNGIETRLQAVETELSGAIETTNNILLMI